MLFKESYRYIAAPHINDTPSLLSYFPFKYYEHFVAMNDFVLDGASDWEHGKGHYYTSIYAYGQ